MNGIYFKTIEPNLKQIIQEHIHEVVSGLYKNSNYGSPVSQLEVNQENLDITFQSPSIENKQVEIKLQKVDFQPPIWDKDAIESIDRSVLEQYETYTNINDIIKHTSFGLIFTLTGSDKSQMIIKHRHAYSNEVGIVLRSKSILGSEPLDDIYEQ